MRVSSKKDFIACEFENVVRLYPGVLFGPGARTDGNLVGGMIALLIVTIAALRMRITRTKRNAVDVTVLYWHFMDVLWIYLFVLLFFWSYRRVPAEVFESARLDGAGPLALWRWVALPLSVPTLVAVGVLTFWLYWSDFINRAHKDGIEVWGFANNHYQGHSPATIRTLVEKLGLPQRVPVRVEQLESNPKDRRTSPRVDATYRIAYECFNSWGVKVDEGPAKTVDISGRGALIEIPRGVPLDASMVLLVMAPFHMLMVKGSVVHSRRSESGTFHVRLHRCGFRQRFAGQRRLYR